VALNAAAAVGPQIRRARVQNGLTQAGLAEAVGKTQTAISYWEAGRRLPNLDDILALADVLDVDPNYFFGQAEPRKSQRVLLRAEATLRPLHELSAEIERFATKAEKIEPLERVVRVDSEDPTRAAQQILAQARVTAPPIPVEKLARQCGVTVLEYAFSDRVSGVLLDLDTGPVIGCNANHVDGRKRFTVAHELGHFVLKHHDHFHIDLADAASQGEPPDFNWLDERNANEFAAQLLMPAAMVIQAYDADTQLSRLAKKFRVSREALGWRLVNLGLLR